ncbi:MAG: hypothetical protein AAGA90_03485 [Actinomycetota bacterium]
MNRRLIPVVVMLTLFAGCGSEAGPELAEPTPTTTTLAEPDPPPTTMPTVTDSVAREVAPEPEPVPEPELDAEQILTATVLIASGGDLEAAITSGIIGEAEAEAALRALESGSIDDLLAD